MKSFHHYVTKYWPLLALGVIVLVLGIINHKPGTILSGGDNLHPEFNFWLNISRSIYSVWQEYQGVGLLAGMGHAADLPRQLILLVLSLVIPVSSLRYIWTMLTLFIGSSGAYYLIKAIIDSLNQESKLPQSNDLETRDLHQENKFFALNATHFAFAGALFYIFNLATLQTYYTPFEVFTSHFAALPWLLYLTIHYFQKPSRKQLIIFILVSILAIPQGYVPTVFIVYLAATCILTLFLIFPSLRESDIRKSPLMLIFESFQLLLRNAWKRFTFFFLIIFLINAFWLIPFAYFTITSSHVDVDAKINQMASENIYLLNKEFGNIQNVSLLKGFWFNNVEPDLNGKSIYMLKPWRDYMQNPVINTIGYLLFAIIILGIIQSIRQKKRLPLAFVVLFLFSFTMLTTDTPPFAWIVTFLRTYIPLFSEVFRFPFTKFSLLAGLTYAVFFALGMQALIAFFSSRFSSYTKKLLVLIPLLFALFSLLPLLFTLPMFTRNLFYFREQFTYPKEYTQLYRYFATKDQSARIADFPQSTFWDWKFYTFGYSGSGFMWYTMSQPVLDRTFDMFSPQTENYYYEIAQNVYAKNPWGLNQVLQKYQISYLIIDKNITYPPSPQALFYPELEEILSKMPTVRKTATFHNILVYNVRLSTNPHLAVFTSPLLPTVNTYTWSSDDTAYQDLSTYMTLPPLTNQQPMADYFYPFRSLFSLKSQQDNTFSQTEEGKTIALKAILPPSAKGTYLTVPSYLKSEAAVPVDVFTRKLTDTESGLYLRFRTPNISLNDQYIWGATIEYPITTLSYQRSSSGILPSYSLNINGVVTVPLTQTTSGETTTFLSLTQDNYLTLNDDANNTTQAISLNHTVLQSFIDISQKRILLPQTNVETVLRITVPKIQDNYANYETTIAKETATMNCNVFRNGTTTARTVSNDGVPLLNLAAQNATACSAFYSTSLTHKEGYAIFLDHRNISGKSFHFWLLNENENYAPIDTYLQKSDLLTTASFILPPQDPFGNAYSFHLDSISIGKDVSANELEHLAMYPIPYQFLTSLVLSHNAVTQTAHTKNQALTVMHPNETKYIVMLSTQNSLPLTLVLSQAYHPGWQAYALKPTNNTFIRGTQQLLPFLFGTKLSQHMMVNNWENGWVIDAKTLREGKTQIVIFFAPQLLEYLGFLCLIFVLFLPIIFKNNTQLFTKFVAKLDR